MQPTAKPEAFWENIGKSGYGNLYASGEVEQNVYHDIGLVAAQMGQRLGLTDKSRVLDLGCGDGRFTNTLLATHFGDIAGIDLAQAAIERATSMAAKPNMHFTAANIITLDYSKLGRFDGVFLYGILHHVKSATSAILKQLSQITDNIVIMEPNGNHILRKLLEKTEAYKNMGEDSFRTKEFEAIIDAAGFEIVEWKRLNLFPNFTPTFVFKLLKPIEPMIENSKFLRALCTVNMWSIRTKKV